MNRLVDKLNTPTAVVIAVVLVVSANGFLYFFYSRDSEQEPFAEEVQVLPRAEASSDTPNAKGPDHPVEPGPQEKPANKDGDDKEDPQPKQTQDTERKEARAEKDENAHSNSPSPKVASSSHKQPSSAALSSGESIEEAPPVEASALPATPVQEAPPATTSVPATAPASAPPATTTDTDASQDYSGTAQGSPADGGGAGLIPAVPPTQDVSPAPQVGVAWPAKQMEVVAPPGGGEEEALHR